MAKQAVEHLFNGLTNPLTSYDSTKTNIGTQIVQANGKIGPMDIAVARPMENGPGFAVMYPHAISISDRYDWVFAIENVSAGSARRIALFTFDKQTAQFNWEGYITCTVNSGNSTRGFRALRDTFTTGTVSVAGSNVTGSTTNFVGDGIAAGARIGFGSTDPTQITQWYEISSIASNTALTLATTAATQNNVPYVIEELRFVISTTNSTPSNGGLFLVKGMNYNCFSGAVTATLTATADNQRYTYWLADASTVTNTAACGCAIEAKQNNSLQRVFIIDGSGSLKVYVYNIRASLTNITASKTTSAWSLTTGTYTSTGSATNVNNGRIDTLYHGVANGQLSLFFVTTSRIYRAAISNITSGNANWVSDWMIEVPPTGGASFLTIGTFSSIEVSTALDCLIIMNSTAYRAYATKYYTSAEQFDHVFLVETRQTDQSTADPDLVPVPTPGGNVLSIWAESGFLYLCRNSGGTPSNQMYAMPIICHWKYATNQNQYVITPKLSAPGATKFHRLYVNAQDYVGGSEIGYPTEPYRIYARTSGIDDNTGSWVLLGPNYDLSAFSANSEIQFKIEFKIMGLTCIPAKIYGLTVIYETDGLIPSQLEWSLNDSNVANGTIGFVQVSSFGGVPTLNISYYNSDNSLIFSQNSAGTTNGSFQYWNGSGWVNGIGADTIGLRRRFVPTYALINNSNVYIKISTV